MKLTVVRACVSVAVAGLCIAATVAAAQDAVIGPLNRGLPAVIGPEPNVRVLLLPSLSVTRRGLVPAPAEATQALKRAIESAAEVVVFVDDLRQATDLLQLTNYQLAFDEQDGVRQLWHVTFRPLFAPDEPAAARAKPTEFEIVVQGETLSECARLSGERLRERLRPLLPRFRPVVPR